MESRPYEESAQYLGKPYNTLTQNDVRSELKKNGQIYSKINMMYPVLMVVLSKETIL